MTKEELQKECESLRFENRRLLNYIAAFRMRFGDCAVNQAITELVPKAEPKAPQRSWHEVFDGLASNKYRQPTTPQ